MHFNRKRYTSTTIAFYDANVQSASDYYAFGQLLPGRNAGENYRYGFNGMEEDNEIKGEGNSYTTEFRQYDPRIGRWLSMDPLAAQFPWQTPYCAFDNKPINKIDPKGESATDPSTHTDKDGNVVAVYDDGDKGVYKHKGDIEETKKELKENYNQKSNTSAGGEKMGTTKYWDEFLVPKEDNSTPTDIAPNTKILFGTDWKALVDWGNDHANRQDLTITMDESKSNQLLDIKTNQQWAPPSSGGTMTGRLLNGQYSTARSAGNYLAGMNGITGTIQGYHISGVTYMKLAGAYQVGELTNIKYI
jgi:RHS repeat-associated protein